MWTHGIVAAIVMYDATHSALMVGMVGVVQFGPQLILSPISGKWADNGNQARQILLGRVLCVAGSVSRQCGCSPTRTSRAWRSRSPCSSDPCSSGSASWWAARRCSRSCRISFATANSRPPWRSTACLIPSGASSGPRRVPIWPPTSVRPGHFAVSAALHLVFAIFLLVVTFPSPPERRAGTDFRVRTAIRYVWRDRPLLLALVAGDDRRDRVRSVITLTPSMADELGGGTHLVGLLSASFGVGAGVGMAALAIMGGRMASARVSSIGMVGLAAGCGV